jgi:glycosyltransferase involved in cell wall biosynthesis
MTTALALLFSTGFGGMERYAIEQAREMVKRGHKLIFISKKGTPTAQALRDETGFEKMELSAVQYIDVGAMLKIRSLIRQNRVTLVHAHRSADLGLIAPALWGIGNVRLLFSNYMQVPTPKKDLYHRLEYRRVCKILVASEELKRNAEENLPFAPGKVEVLPYGIDLGRFDPARAQAGWLRAKFNLREGQPVIGVISRLDPLKGQMEMIRAMPRILEKHPGAILLLVGGETPELEGKYLGVLKADALTVGVADSVIFAGETNDTAPYLAGFTVYVLPSRSETFSIGCLEAMAMGAAIVGTDAGGTPEMLGYGEYGLLATPDDPASLADKTLALLDDAALRKKLGEKARSAAMSKYNKKAVMERLSAIYTGSAKKPIDKPRN